MRDDTDEPDRTHRQPRQIQRVISRVVDQVGARDDLSTTMQITLGVLDGHDVRMCGQFTDDVEVDRDNRAWRNVVQDHGHVHRVRDRGEMCQQSRLRGPRVVGGDDQESMRSGSLALTRQLDAVGGVIGAGPGDDACAISHRRHHLAQQGQLLGVGGYGRLSGGAGEDKAIASGVDQMRGKPHRGIDVKGAIGIERSHHRGEHGAEPRHCSTCCHGMRIPAPTKRLIPTGCVVSLGCIPRFYPS
ncbi:Uncharacterised protein [Mycobacteroides abscessus subsp. abscessus]|nr:Uncharacterised protein [Mycobacteroides abscessus subsp. abscessus]